MSMDQPTFSHSGQRYLLGYTVEEYGIWDRNAPGPPVRRFPKSDQGWNEAWAAYQQFEAPPSPAPEPSPAAAAPSSPPAATPSAPTTPIAASPAPAATPAVAGPPRAPIQINAKMLSQVLTIAGWALLVLFPLAGIATFTVGGSFYTISQGLAYLAFGPALWGICLTLAKVAAKNG